MSEDKKEDCILSFGTTDGNAVLGFWGEFALYDATNGASSSSYEKVPLKSFSLRESPCDTENDRYYLYAFMTNLHQFLKEIYYSDWTEKYCSYSRR
jgi:hypothetical protein